jgi:coenzyme F420-0:L-glutamate ligase/coenzyme F420-1:gamma-L-glutamate ligase
MKINEDEIRARRSIRKYTNQLVSTDCIRSILETASFAPSAHNAQPWQFVIITVTEDKNMLAQAMASTWLKELEKDHIPNRTRLATVKRSIQQFTAAPVLILACLTQNGMDSYPDRERQQSERDLGVQSLAAAVQTLLLAASLKGLGTCWYCAPLFCKPVVRQTLGIPADVEPQAIITLGFPNEVPSLPSRNPVEYFVHNGRWGNRL